MSDVTTTTTGQDTGADTTTTATETTTVAPSFSMYGNEGVNADLISSIGDNAPSVKNLLSKYPSLEKLESGVKHMNWLSQQKGLTALDDDAPDDVRARQQEILRSVLHVPEDPSGYKIDKPEGFPDELGWSDERVSRYAEIAHKHNISPAALQELVSANAQEQMAQFAELPELQKAAELETLNEIKAEHGPKFDDMLTKAESGLKIARSLGALSDEEMKAMSPTQNPALFRTLSTLGSLLQEQKYVKPDGSSDSSGLQSELNALRKDERYMSGNPQDQQWVAAEQGRIFKLAQARGINLK